jgi:hypothetical protein
MCKIFGKHFHDIGLEQINIRKSGHNCVSEDFMGFVGDISNIMY